MESKVLEFLTVLLVLTFNSDVVRCFVVTESDVTFHLRTRNADVEVQITDENFSNVISDRKFYFVIHGWLSSHSEQWVKNLTNVYLKQDDCNVIQVDWRAPADQLEYISSRNTEGVGYFVGQFIVKLMDLLGVSAQNVTLVGHSFGSHVSGLAGKEVTKTKNVKIAKIIATDPARRPFESSSIADVDKLTEEDAITVVGIHTDAGYAGYTKPTGTVDFYPNGGANPQPGCEDAEETHTCSHVIVNEFLIEAIENPDAFLATKCDSYEKYLAGECDGNERVALGGDLSNLQGNFYFQTNPQPPYSKN